jgi:selenophosphate synthase
LLALAYDPQTSGGLLIALPADKAGVLGAVFAERNLFLARVGQVVDGEGVALA